jgi:Family of unknown function (DUF5675)
MELTLIRKYFPKGTNGVLWLGERKVCATIELPWKKNQRRISCIPEGRYELRMRYTPRFGKHLMIISVVDRTNILIHAFNNALAESKGCIAPVADHVGEGEGIFSRITLEKLVALTYPVLQQSKPVFLTIKN